MSSSQPFYCVIVLLLKAQLQLTHSVPAIFKVGHVPVPGFFEHFSVFSRPTENWVLCLCQQKTYQKKLQTFLYHQKKKIVCTSFHSLAIVWRTWVGVTKNADFWPKYWEKWLFVTSNISSRKCLWLQLFLLQRHLKHYEKWSHCILHQK